MVSAAIAFGIVCVSLISVACVFTGKVTQWKEKHDQVMHRFSDGGTELEDTEDPKTINPFMDDPADDMLTENQKPLEQLYHKYVHCRSGVCPASGLSRRISLVSYSVHEY